jgi:hypothetical protein
MRSVVPFLLRFGSSFAGGRSNCTRRASPACTVRHVDRAISITTTPAFGIESVKFGIMCAANSVKHGSWPNTMTVPAPSSKR